MRHIKSDVVTVGFGGCMGMSGFLLAVGKKVCVALCLSSCYFKLVFQVSVYDTSDKVLYHHRESAMSCPIHELCYIIHLAQQEDKPLTSKMKLRN